VRRRLKLSSTASSVPISRQGLAAGSTPSPPGLVRSAATEILNHPAPHSTLAALSPWRWLRHGIRVSRCLAFRQPSPISKAFRIGSRRLTEREAVKLAHRQLDAFHRSLAGGRFPSRLQRLMTCPPNSSSLGGASALLSAASRPKHPTKHQSGERKARQGP